ncbi:MAG: hypothetical protein Q7T41_03270 [Candidatus Saccharibacteria bacterium]|nr:hypothetical protein [Candidatus Saccharibacteria bacterium]
MVENYTTKTRVIIIIVSLVLTYIFASWAIDSGSLVAHVLAYLSVYSAVYFVISMFKRRNNDLKK